ncbi:hypothetical protein BST61_g10827 [Cercospora zeina]
MPPPCQDQGEAATRYDNDITPESHQKTATNASSSTSVHPLAETMSSTRSAVPTSAQTGSRKTTRRGPTGADEEEFAAADVPETLANVVLPTVDTLRSQPVPAVPLKEAAPFQLLPSPVSGFLVPSSCSTPQLSTISARPPAFAPLLAGHSPPPPTTTEPEDWLYTTLTRTTSSHSTPLPGNSITRTIHPCRLTADQSDSDLEIVAAVAPAIVDHVQRSSEDFPSTLRSLAATLQKIAHDVDPDDGVQDLGLRKPPTKDDMDFAARLLNDLLHAYDDGASSRAKQTPICENDTMLFWPLTKNTRRETIVQPIFHPERDFQSLRGSPLFVGTATPQNPIPQPSKHERNSQN